MEAQFDEAPFDGFQGFVPVGCLHGSALEGVPLDRGVYVARLPSAACPGFSGSSTGGHLQGRDPLVEVERLRAEWVEGTRALYVGRAECLRLRIWELVGFAFGTPTRHWGGRVLWQLQGRATLEVGWRVTPETDPAKVESDLLAEFKAAHGQRLPFANLRS